MRERRERFLSGCARRPARFLALALCFVAFPGRAAPFDEAEVHTLLAGPRTVSLQDGRAYRGEITGLRDGSLRVLAFDGGGEVEYSLPVEDVASVRFPGEEVVATALELYQNSQYKEALPLLEAIYRQRLTCLPLLSEDQEKPLVALPRAYRATGADIDAVATARRLLDGLGTGARRDELEALILQGYLRLGLYERAADEARSWCASRGRYPASALGWTVLAEIALREERYEDALWVALQPIAFSGARPVEHLDRAYASAIHACRMLEDDEYGLRLFQEARERRFAWPDDAPGHPETRAFYGERAAASGEDPAGKDSGDPAIDPRPALDDLNLPLRDVRRLLLSLPNSSTENKNFQPDPS